jgi:hypothetical protein
MRTLRLIVSELFGLFVDDARLAVLVLALVLGVAAFTHFVPNQPLATVVILAVGCLAILSDATLRAARR